jgi:hypothetical protein
MFERNSVPEPNLPTTAALERLLRHLALSPYAQDLYLAYEGTPQLRLAGILVAAKGDIDRIIAYCPLAPSAKPGTPEWVAEVRLLLGIASRVAERPESSRNAPDVIWLGDAAAGDRPVPNWVYALACIPLTYPWNGDLLSPRPFCPDLFGRMASQPQALRWLERQRSPSPAAYAGGPARAPAAPL